MTGAVLMLAVVLGGLALRLPRRMIAGIVALFWLAFVLVHLISPAGGPLAVMIGGSLFGWVALAVLAGIVLAYRAGLRALRARAATQGQNTSDRPKALFSDAELDRYSRHIMLREIGGPGQAALKRAKVLVIGAGGLGSPALYYLAAAGVGTIGVVDDDVVSNSNLQRQILHRDADIGMDKVFSAEANLTALNPFIEIRPYNRRLSAEDAPALIADYDLVLDGCDNFETRYLVNAACVATGVPLLSGAITQWEGQVSLFDPARGTPCYACIFPKAPAPGLAPSCAEAGVVGALPGIIGATMAAEAIKQITRAGQGLGGRLLIHDALWGESRQIALHPRADCPVCAARRDDARRG